MGTGSAYASAALNKHLGKQPSRTEHKRIDMMKCLNTQKIGQYDVKISNIRVRFEMTRTVNKVDKGVLLSIPNPQYNHMIRSRCFRNLLVWPRMIKTQSWNCPYIILILGANEYSRIKTHTKPKIGRPVNRLQNQLHWAGQWYQQARRWGWQLCSLDVLGLEGRADRNQQYVYEEFKELQRQRVKGWYKAGLLWKHGHKPLWATCCYQS